MKQLQKYFKNLIHSPECIKYFQRRQEQIGTPNPYIRRKRKQINQQKVEKMKCDKSVATITYLEKEGNKPQEQTSKNQYKYLKQVKTHKMRQIQDLRMVSPPPKCLFQSDIITLCLKIREIGTPYEEKNHIYARYELFRGSE